MYYRVLQDAGDYHAGDVLDLGDAELAAQIGRRVPLLKLAARPESAAVIVPEPVAAVAPAKPSAKRRKRG